MATIIDLPAVVAGLNGEDKQLFERFFRVRISLGPLVIPKEMIPWADKTFGSVKDVEKQKVLITLNNFTFEGAVFNELRAKRPMSAKSAEDAATAISASVGDPFCNPLKGTPADSFGRVKGRHCVTASNAAKFDALHGLVIFRKHNPLDFSEAEVQDYFATANKWFEKAHKNNPGAKYPFLFWNCLWKSGASIVHGHLQMVLGEGMHYADPELYNKVRLDYSRDFSASYFDDLFKAHKLVGLGVDAGELKVFASITPKKDKEISIIGKSFNKELTSVAFKCLKCLTDDFGVESFNVCVIFPPLEDKKLFKKTVENAEWKGFPVILRMLERGKLSNKTADIGGMELYGHSVVTETDPYRVFEKLLSRLA